MSLLSSPSPKFHLTAFQRHHGHELAYDIGGWHTPAWHQTWHLRTYEGGGSGQSPVGCGNTAWTMLYAYWDQFKGKTGLFETDLETIWHPADRSVLPGTEIDSVMWHIAGLTNTSHGRFRWSWEQEWGEYGRTTPANMRRGSRYAYEKGYPATSVTRLRGPERTKWDMIDAEIAADRPVILLINNYGNTNYGLIPTHYVIVERTLLIEERGLDDYGYHVNWGHGAGAEQPHKWLWTAGTGLDDSAFSAFLVRMRTDLMIAVDGVLGTDAITLPVESNDPQQLTFHVANLRDQDTARVQVTVEQAGGRTYVPTGGTLSVQEGEQRTFPVGRPKSVTLLAQCGSQSVSTKVFFDYAPPTFESVGVSLHEDSVVLTAYGMYDDGQWDNSDYQTMVTLTQGSSQAAYPPRAGKSATLYGLPPGTHTGQMRIMDGCGRVSEPRPFEFTVGTTAPIVSFVSPPEGAGVRRNTAATVTIRAGDMDDGIKEVVIYRDQVFSGDLDSTRLHRFGQSDFTTGRVEEKSCSIRFDMTPGEHKLIAVAEDHSRRTTTVERTIRVVEP